MTMEEAPINIDDEDPLLTAVAAEVGLGATDGALSKLPPVETRRLGKIAGHEVEEVPEDMSARRERLASQAMASELARSARRSATR